MAKKQVPPQFQKKEKPAPAKPAKSGKTPPMKGGKKC